MKETKDNEGIFKERLESLASDYGMASQEGIKASLIECQDIFNFVSSSHQEEIARAFQVDIKLVKTLIKFIPSIKESIVEYEVVCCLASRCAANGSMEVIRAIKETLGIDFNQTSEDGKVRLTSRNCFKKCGQGPNITVNGKFYHKMNKNKAIDLMESLLKD
jgi:NADH:ubiquinone oxidoreductase subunit E